MEIAPAKDVTSADLEELPPKRGAGGRIYMFFVLLVIML